MIHQLKEQILCEKYLLISEQIKQWKIKKQKVLEQYYRTRINNFLKKSEQEYEQLCCSAQMVLEIIFVQKDFLVNLKQQKTEPIKRLQIMKTSRLFQDLYVKIKTKKDKMLQYRSFVITFSTVLTNELKKLKLIFENFKCYQKELSSGNKQLEKQQSQVINALLTKKTRKLFQLTKFSQIQSIFQKKFKLYHGVYTKIETNFISLKEKTIKILEDILKNLQYYRSIHKEVYGEDIGEQLETHFKAIMVNVNDQPQSKQINTKLKQQEQQSQLNSNIKQDLWKIFIEALNLLTVRTWNNIELSQNKYIYKNQIAYLTLDDKCLLIQNGKILKEFDLRSVLIEKPRSQMPQQKLKLRFRKSSRSIQILFDSIEREDQFKMYLEELNNSENL